MSMKTVMLHGELAELFGGSWQLDVLTPAEAVLAIETNRPGFTRHLMDSERQGAAYQILLGEAEIDPATLAFPFSDREIFHIVPVFSGSGQNGAAVGKIVVGAIIAIASMGYGLAAYGAEGAGMMEGAYTGTGFASAMAQPALLGMSYGTVAMMGASLMFSGISTLLSKSPESQAAKDGSFVFAGATNTTKQGVPIPIGYGELVVGSVVISAGIKVANENIT
jgi:predicted phage tail protein